MRGETWRIGKSVDFSVESLEGSAEICFVNIPWNAEKTRLFIPSASGDLLLIRG